MTIPAQSYLGESGTSLEALDCLRRDLLSGDAACEQNHRLSVWQVLLLTPAETNFHHKLVDDARCEARAAIERHTSARPDEEFDPLSNNDSWSSYYKDEELRAVIVQDCIRLFPEEPWFSGVHVQKSLQDCLFTWCKSNSDVLYKQGMHEIAGIVIWVVLHGSARNSTFVDEDCLTLFQAIMSPLKPFYHDAKHGTSAMLEHANRIQNELLPHIDAALSSRLVEMEIAPQLYCLKWLRLVFIREFQLSDVLKLWDILFAVDPSLEILDYVACAMLLQFRTTILENDVNTALTVLMRPGLSSVSPSKLVQEALQLRSPQIVSSPPLTSHDQHNNIPTQMASRSTLATTAPYTMHALIEQADKLGINSYVWGAVEEVKRNVTPIISETRLLRTTSRDGPSSSSSSSTTPGSVSTLSRDRELAAFLALTISNLKNGDQLETNISRLEDLKLVLQGRKHLAELSKAQSSGNVRPSSAPHTSMTFSNPQRAAIKIPAIKHKSSFNHESSAKVLGTNLSDPFAAHKDDIPLSTSPKRSPGKVSADFSYLFADEKSNGSTFNRSRKT